MRRLVLATAVVGLLATSCAPESDPDSTGTVTPNTIAPTTETQAADEATYLVAAQIAVGGEDNLPLMFADGQLTEPGESALEFGHLACSMSVAELHDLFFESWPDWRGPSDTPEQMHQAAAAHLCG